MLSAAVRPSAHAAVCAACARQARRTAHSLANSSSRLTHSSRAAQQGSSALPPSLAPRRTQATLAQASDRIEPTTDVAEEHEHDSPDEAGEAVEAAQEGEQKEREASAAESNEVQREKEDQVGASSGEGADAAAAQVDGQDAAVLDVPPATEEADQALASLLDALQAEADSEPSSASTFDEPAQPSDTLTSSSSAVPSASEPSSVPSELNDALAEVYGASTSSSDTVNSPLFTTPDPEDPPPGPVRGANLPENGPQLSDLFRLRPKRFRIPVADSPDSFRTVYQKVWSDAADKVSRAFNKHQLNDLAGPDGLALDLTDARLRTATPGKKQRFWKSKRMEQMSKRELVHTILILEFGMIHPDRVPEAVKRTGPQTVDALVLSNRTLFLLLSPKSRTIAKITNELGVKTQFRRSPQSGQIELMLKGNQKSVAAAREEVEMVDDLRECGTADLTLPLPASDLRPEIFQAVSRAAKVFLEPSSSSPSTTLSASAVWPASLTTGSRLLNTALSAHLAQTRTSLYASVPSNLDRLRYSMTPLTPYTPVSVLEHAGAAAFARVKSLSLAPKDVVEESDPAFAAQRELADWTERTKLERTERIPVFIPESRRDASSTGGLLSRLEAPFSSDAAVEVQARFGHVAFPLYPPATPEKTGLEPVCQGQWPFRTLVSWVEKQASKVKSVFIPSPPTDLLQSTGVLSALPVAPSPLSSIFSLAYPSPISLKPAADPAHELAKRKDLDKWPAMESREYRRWVYKPQVVQRTDRAAQESAEGEKEATESVAAEADLTERLEVEMEVEEDAMGRLELLKTQIRVVQENKADLMVPTAATDAQISMSSTVTLPPGAYPEQLAADDLHNVTRPPLTVTHGPRTYVLATDRRVRRTVFTPPKPASGGSSLAPHPLFASSSASKPAGDAAGPALQQVQETWTSLYPTDVGLNAARGSDVWLALTPLDEPVKVDELRRSGAFKRGLEVVEQRLASVAQPSSLSSSSTPSKLLSLPAELLRAIFSLAYPPSGPRPATPICKAPHPLLLELLYSPDQARIVQLARRSETHSQSEGGVRRARQAFHHQINWAEEGYGKETKEQPPPPPIKVKDVQGLFRTMAAVKEINIHGSMHLVEVILLPETAGTCLPELTDLDLTSTFRGWDDPWSTWHYAALPFYRKLDSLEITVEREPSSIESSPPPSLSRTAPPLFPSLSRLVFSGPCASSTSAKNFLGAFNNALVLRLIDFDSNLSLLSLLKALPDATPLFELTLFSGVHDYDPELEAVLPKFSSIERLELSGTTITPSASFYDALRALPQLTSLVFGPDADASTDELAALVANPRKHPKLEELTLDNVYGEMGTRIKEDAGGVPFDAEYDDGEHRWGIYRDWVRPHWRPFFSLDGLQTLLEVAEGAGVRVSGDAVEAIKVDEAYERELDFLFDVEAREGAVWE